MKRYRKYLLCFAVCLIIFALVWHFENLSYFKIRTRIPSETLFLLGFASAGGGYLGLEHHAQVYSLIFLFFLYKMKIGESSIRLLRLSSREECYKKHIINIVIIALIFSTAMHLINLLFVSIHMSLGLMEKTGFFHYFPVAVLISAFYFIRIGIITQLLSDLMQNKTVPYLLTFVLCYLEQCPVEFVEEVPTTWRLCVDLQLFYQCVSGTASIGYISIVFVRQISIMVVLLMVGACVFKRKDFLTSEKK